MGPATRRSQKTGMTSGLLRAQKVGALAFLEAAGVRLADTETIDHRCDEVRGLRDSEQRGAAAFTRGCRTNPGGHDFLSKSNKRHLAGRAKSVRSSRRRLSGARTRRWSRTRPHVIVSVVQRPSFMRQPRVKAVAHTP